MHYIKCYFKFNAYIGILLDIGLGLKPGTSLYVKAPYSLNYSTIDIGSGPGPGQVIIFVFKYQ